MEIYEMTALEVAQKSKIRKSLPLTLSKALPKQLKARIKHIIAMHRLIKMRHCSRLKSCKSELTRASQPLRLQAFP